MSANWGGEKWGGRDPTRAVVTSAPPPPPPMPPLVVPSQSLSGSERTFGCNTKRTSATAATAATPAVATAAAQGEMRQLPAKLRAVTMTTMPRRRRNFQAFYVEQLGAPSCGQEFRCGRIWLRKENKFAQIRTNSWLRPWRKSSNTAAGVSGGRSRS